MDHHQPIGEVDSHVQSLPDPRRQEIQPEIVAGGGHQKQDEQRGEAERLEGEADEFPVSRPIRELRREFRQIVQHPVIVEQEPGVDRRDAEGQHPEMAPVVEVRQEAGIEPRQRADRQHHGQHEKGANAESAQPDVERARQALRRREPPGDRGETADEQRYGGEQNGVVDELGPVPLHGAVFDAHQRSPFRPAQAGGSVRKNSASAKPSPTASARNGQIAR